MFYVAMVKVATRTNTVVWRKVLIQFSPTVQRNCMAFGVVEASISVSASLNLGLCILFGFGVISVSLWPHVNVHAW